MPIVARFVAISATSKREAKLLRGCFLVLDFLDPIRNRFRRGKYVVQGGAVIRGGLVPVVLNHMMNTAEKCLPGFRLILLKVPILILERDVTNEIDRGVAGLPVCIPCRECQGVTLQIDQHTSDQKAGSVFI